MAVYQRHLRGNATQVPDILEYQPEAFGGFTLTPLPASPSPTISKASELAVRFKKSLLAKLKEQDQLFDHIFQSGDEEVYLCSVNDTYFTIQISDLVLEHQGRINAHDDSCYIQIRFGGKSAPQLHGYCSRFNKTAMATTTEADFFLPLGWLVEHGKDGMYCPTRYVCLLNISTQPMSIWLMYDYVDCDLEIQNTTAVYDDSIIGEAASELTKAESLLGGSDIMLLYRDITDWVPNATTYGTVDVTEKRLLGPSTRAFTCTPPKHLLDNISGLP
ncbi:MAG: hypothetical protein Q9207_005012 [Kuettlingeria erythrocarpa]